MFHCFSRVFPFIFAYPNMALAVPGTSSSALVLASAALGAPSGADKLDPRFSAMLSQAKVVKSHMDFLGDADCESTAVFGHVARPADKFLAFLKNILGLAPNFAQ